MTRLHAHIGKTTDMVSAFFLLLAVILTGGYGPSAAPMATAQSSATDASAGGHRSVPSVSKPQLLASEAEDDKATSWSDGKAKVFLPSEGFQLAPLPVVANHATQTAVLAVAIAASPYEARAPPAVS